MELPKNFILEAVGGGGNNCLSYLTGPAGLRHFLRFDSAHAGTVFQKLAVEPAETGEDLVHIRCCYNNKYLRRSSSDDRWITASAPEPNEDTTSPASWQCTLFKPVFLTDNVVQLLHVQLGLFLVRSQNATAPELNNCLFAHADTTDAFFPDHHRFLVTPWESFLKLPNYVAFKGDNGRYLVPFTDDGTTYLRFSCADKRDRAAWHETYISPRGTSFGIKSKQLDKFWRRGGRDWIVCVDRETGDFHEDDSFLFRLLIYGKDNRVALRSVKNNNYFCGRSSSADGKTMVDCLNANFSFVTSHCQLDVCELVTSRRYGDISESNLRLDCAQVYDPSTLVLAQGCVANPTDVEVVVDWELPRGLTTTTTDTFRVDFGGWMRPPPDVEGAGTVKAVVPRIVNGGKEVRIPTDGEVKRSFQWGLAKKEPAGNKVEVVPPGTFKVKVKPRTCKTVAYVATMATCDVPFAYTHEDVSYDGETGRYAKSDGLFTGTNAFDFRFQEEEEEELVV